MNEIGASARVIAPSRLPPAQSSAVQPDLGARVATGRISTAARSTVAELGVAVGVGVGAAVGEAVAGGTDVVGPGDADGAGLGTLALGDGEGDPAVEQA